MAEDDEGIARRDGRGGRGDHEEDEGIAGRNGPGGGFLTRRCCLPAYNVTRIDGDFLTRCYCCLTMILNPVKTHFYCSAHICVVELVEAYEYNHLQ